MNETKWAPGPWVVVGEYYDIYAKDENNYANNYICQSSKSQGVRRKANAHLITAGPDLYAATDWVDSKLQTFWPPDMDDLDEVDVTLTYREIRALINARRKARGE